VKLDNIHAFNNIIRVAGYIVAPLVGALLGLLAVASEVDNRTVRLAWTQSISRTRWFVAKAGVGAVLVTMILVPTAIVLSWWSGTIGDRDLFARETYGIAGWDLVAYGLFMFALTLLLGAVIRRVGWLLRRPFSCSSSRHFPCHRRCARIWSRRRSSGANHTW